MDKWTEKRVLSFLAPFDLDNRSKKAWVLAQEHLKRIRQTEEILTQLPTEIELYNRQKSPYDYAHTGVCGKITSELESERTGRVKIVFWDSTELEEYRQMISAVQKIRDKLLAGIDQPPTILIVAEGQNGFSCTV